VLANAKNSFGAYTGIKPTAFVFRDGVITASDAQYAGIACADATYEPFPDLQAALGAAPQVAR
jgi:hypothetical protein